ncbi:Holliday junction branch migration protein RuvA [bacterium]|nr:MAG: Holliday junction branch migration protein RuvA [bacterium]QQR62210.1 MAG: Holliday junction branch migration protein RuvA [bacterium]QQR63231.1 MAG: Holliday junction branch migration protein RuvA [bacterium]
MISHITGRVKEVGQSTIVVETNGFGLVLCTPQPNLFEVNTDCLIYVHFYWHQETGPSLFGFHSLDEKNVFLLLIQCTGVGPKLALTCLATLSPGTIIRAIQNDDYKAIASVQGIGTKKAETITLLLKEKANAIQLQEELASEVQLWPTVCEALTSLGYSKNEILTAGRQIKKEMSQKQLPFDQLMRKALVLLSK